MRDEGLEVTIILGAIVVAIFAIGIVDVYGETYTELIEIPIPANVTGMETKKSLSFLSNDLLEYTITLRFHLGQNGTEWFEKELTEVGILKPADVTNCPDRFYLDLDGVTCYPILSTPTISEGTEKPKLLTEYEEDLIKLTEQDDKFQTKDSLEYEEKLAKLKQCLQGIDQAQGIQQIRSFYTSDSNEEYTDIYPQDHRGTRGMLDRAIEQCIAQEKLLPILGDVREIGDIRTQQGWYGIVETPHGERAIIDEDKWATVPNHETDSLQDHYQKSFQQNVEAFDRMCLTEFVSTAFKIQQGCPVPQIVFEGESNNPTGVGEGKFIPDKLPNNQSDGGGVTPPEGWDMTPLADRTFEQNLKCWDINPLHPTEYHRAVCGTYGN